MIPLSSSEIKIDPRRTRCNAAPDGRAANQPFAVATFKYTSPLAYIGAASFLAHALGIELGTVRLLALVPLSVAMSLGVPGVPGGWFTAAPVFVAAGLPAEVIGVLLAVDTIPDIFRTLGNVTGDLAAATLVGRLTSGRTEESALEPDVAAAPAG